MLKKFAEERTSFDIDLDTHIQKETDPLSAVQRVWFMEPMTITPLCPCLSIRLGPVHPTVQLAAYDTGPGLCGLLDVCKVISSHLALPGKECNIFTGVLPYFSTVLPDNAFSILSFYLMESISNDDGKGERSILHFINSAVY